MSTAESERPRLNPQAALIPLPEKMKGLPVGPNGFVVPWFVPWVEGQPEFRAMDHEKLIRAVRENLCWVCGQHRGRWMTFVIGPMCLVNRISSEPPSHLECARYSARVCPFLSRPKMVRRDASDLFEEGSCPADHAAGKMIERNPGVTLLYTTRSFEPFRPSLGNAGYLFALGDPTGVEWYREGRLATRAEVEESVRTGLPALEDMARQDPHSGALVALRQKVEAAVKHYPAA